MDSLDKDVANCLRFLISHQDEWQPTIEVNKGTPGKGRSCHLPLILIPAESECTTK